jgi:hypothetical protein
MQDVHNARMYLYMYVHEWAILCIFPPVPQMPEIVGYESLIKDECDHARIGELVLLLDRTVTTPRKIFVRHPTKTDFILYPTRIHGLSVLPCDNGPLHLYEQGFWAGCHHQSADLMRCDVQPHSPKLWVRDGVR